MLVLGVAEVVMKQIADQPDGIVRARIRSNIQRVERVTALSGKDSRKPRSPQIAFIAAKGAMLSMTRSWARQTRARRYHGKT
jgi:NAD(P)-dependent dehydrogenase (short-subunit alcohol dehydrogenase family)